jgi:hypothetical protein
MHIVQGLLQNLSKHTKKEKQTNELKFVYTQYGSFYMYGVEGKANGHVWL